MDNQHRLIPGYRELTQQEIDLMSSIKKEGLVLDTLLAAVSQHLLIQAQNAASGEENVRLMAAEPQRWKSIAKTHFQEGLMALTRAVAQPGFF